MSAYQIFATSVVVLTMMIGTVKLDLIVKVPLKLKTSNLDLGYMQHLLVKHEKM